MLEISLFGPFEARLEGVPPTRLRSRKTAWLLALLVMRSGRAVERAWLAGTLWPDSEEAAAMVNLRSTLADLRRVLGPEAGRLRSPSRRTLALDLAAATVDLLEFDAAIAGGDTASLERAVALYRGPLLEGCTEEWVIPEREAREQACLGALETLAACSLNRGDSATAERHLRRVVAIDPLRESAQRALMEAQAAEGNVTAALLTYRELRLRLHGDLNTEPAAATTALFQQLRAGAREREKKRGTERGSVGAGEWARRAGVVARTLASSHPRTLAPAHPPSRLPLPLTRLIGRERESRAIAGLLRDQRLVTLTGIGGVGKTRLALHVVRLTVEAYPDGAWFVELAATSSMASLPQTVVAALEISEKPGCALLEILIDYLRDKRALLVLDNCEHVVEDCASLAAELLRGCPDLRILATSRRPLGLTGEIAYRVPSLAEADAVSLFLERAAAAVPASAGEERLPPVVIEICRRLDRIPLAIELAAAWVKALTLEEIGTRLADRFRLLTGGSRTALLRQQTLRATLDWSHELLTEPERVLLRQLSVFAGGWTLEAAEAICLVPSDVLDLLASLVDQSLVVAEPGASGMRYRLLETVRQYGREKLQAAGEEAAVRTRHRDWCLGLAERARAEFWGPHQADWLDRLSAEQDNLNAALQASLPCQRASAGRAAAGLSGSSEAGDLTPVPLAGLRLGAALWWFWHVRGYRGEGREWLERLLARSPRGVWGVAHTPDDAGGTPATVASSTHARRAWIEVSNGAGCLARGQGDLPAARAHHEASLAVARASDDAAMVAWTLFYLGFVAHVGLDPEAARAHYEDSLALMRASGDRCGIAMALNQLGSIVAAHGGEIDAARFLHEESLDLARGTGNLVVIADALHYLGRLARWREKISLARSLYEEAWEIRRRLGDRGKIAWLLASLGDLAQEQNDWAAAAAYYEQGLEILEALGDRLGTALACQSLARAAIALDALERAHALLERALNYHQQAGSKPGISQVLSDFGRLALAQHDPIRARALYEESLALFPEAESGQRRAALGFDLGDVALHQGDAATARSYYEERLSWGHSRQHQRTVSRALHGLGWVAHATQQPETAQCLFAEAWALRKPLGDRLGMTLCQEGLAAVASQQGRTWEAARLLGAAEAHRQALNVPAPPAWRAFRDLTYAAVRSQLGDAAFSTAWAEGRAMTLDLEERT